MLPSRAVGHVTRADNTKYLPWQPRLRHTAFKRACMSGYVIKVSNTIAKVVSTPQYGSLIYSYAYYLELMLLLYFSALFFFLLLGIQPVCHMIAEIKQ